MKKAIKQRGIAILFAILLVSIVLTVSLILFNITYRELVLSSLARESQFAFYAADSIRNCARRYDKTVPRSDSPFGYYGVPDSDPDPNAPPRYNLYSGPLTTLDCGGSVPSIFTHTNPLTPEAPHIFTLMTVYTDSVSGKKTCANAKVTKYTEYAPLDSFGNPQVGKTLIESRGYNNYNDPTTSLDCYLPTDRTVERASSMIY